MVSLIHSAPLACATCFGSKDDPTTFAANMTILFMLVVLALVLGAFLKFIHHLACCERRAVSPEAQLMGIDPRVPPPSKE